MVDGSAFALTGATVNAAATSTPRSARMAARYARRARKEVPLCGACAVQGIEPGELIGGQHAIGRGHVLREVRRIPGARDDEHVRPACECPRETDLRVGAATGLPVRARDGEERHERHALLAAQPDEVVLLLPVTEA